MAEDRRHGPQQTAMPPHVRWAEIGESALLAGLGSSPRGLSAAEAGRRLREHGPNALPRPLRAAWYRELSGEFLHLFALLLWVAAALAWWVGLPPLAWAIVAVVIVNGLFGYWQRRAAERAVEALEALLPRYTTVRRDGADQTVPAAQVVPGDILVLAEGASVAADARLLRADRLRVDASTLTGESRPIARTAEAVAAQSRVATELPNLVFAGTSVVSGRGEAVAFATGGDSEFGRLARLTHCQQPRPSPLAREIRRVTWVITALALSMGLAFFLVGTGLGQLSPTDGFIFALGILVANVPEGLLPTITLALALGVRRMANRRALVKQLDKVETLGATTVILSDKTGTLTQNRMTVTATWAGGREQRVGPGSCPAVGSLRTEGSGTTDLLLTAALCCDSRLEPHPSELGQSVACGDPTESAILTAALAQGISREDLLSRTRLAELPFDSRRRRMTTVQQDQEKRFACTKGAADAVLPRSTSILWDSQVRPLDARLADAVWQAQSTLAGQGLRVLAVARRDLHEAVSGEIRWSADEVERELTFLGLIAMEDPPRPEVPAAIAACRTAGVRVIMVTGDDGLTAAAIGREVGLYSDDVRQVTGPELDALGDRQLAETFAAPELLFARVTPEHKLRLVEALQARGEVVAVTGDGVNDAPALRRADIGVAMGASGTDVAREAADIVLADDNFASIVAAIEEGRAVYDNLRKFVTYIFASNVPEIVPFVAFVLFRIPLPLTVMQRRWTWAPTSCRPSP
jgi:calcium-translocating P-type ATPase